MDHDIEKRSLLQMGSVCAWIAGMCYIPVVLFAFLSPTSIASYIASNQYFVDFTNYQKYFILLKIFMVLSNAAMIGVVAGVYQ
nr:hypothetical protein [Chlamydiota bacterium]